MQYSTTATGLHLDIEFWCGGVVSVGGELLGRLVLCTTHKLEIVTATLTLRCCEQTKFGHDTLKSIEHEKDFDIFSALDTAGSTGLAGATRRARVAPGIRYAPFSIPIPQGLPPSFYLHSPTDTKDHIEWTIEAQLLVVMDGEVLSRVEHVVVPFIVTQAQPSNKCMIQRLLDPVKLAVATETSSTAYCMPEGNERKIPKSHTLFTASTGLHHIFSYGNSTIAHAPLDPRIKASFFFPRIAGYVDETVFMRLSLENNSCQYVIRNVKVKLVRVRTVGIEEGPGYEIRESVLGKCTFPFDVPTQTTRTTVLSIVPSEISRRITDESLRFWKKARAASVYMDSIIFRSDIMSALREINAHTSLPSLRTRVGKDAKTLAFYSTHGGQTALEDSFSKLLAQDFRFDIKINLYKQHNPYKGSGSGAGGGLKKVKSKRGKKREGMTISQPILLVHPRTRFVGHQHLKRKTKADAKVHSLFADGERRREMADIDGRMSTVSSKLNKHLIRNEIVVEDVKELTGVGAGVDLAGKESNGKMSINKKKEDMERKIKGLDEESSLYDSDNFYSDEDEYLRRYVPRSPLTEEFESSDADCPETRSLLGHERYVW